MANFQDQLISEIAARRDDMVALCQDLVRIDTTNPPGEKYSECAHFLGDRLAKSGFGIEYVRGEGAPGDNDDFPRTNVIARLEGKGDGPCVHFNSHLDVVIAGEGWTFDPFGAEIKDGKIYGRGTCDMKGGLAASVVAVEAFLALKPDFSGVIEISGTVDEETGGFGGVAYLAERGYFSKPKVDHVIIPEPLNKDRICLGHRGAWWAEIETKGHIAHGSMPFAGDNAIRHMAAVLEVFERELFPALARKRTDMPVVPEGAKQSTMNINSVHGGEPEEYEGLPAPIVPDSCRMIIDRRFLIEENLADVKSEVIDILDRLVASRKDFRYEVRDINEILPTMTDKDAPVPRAIALGINKVLGVSADYVISPGSYDQKHIARLGHLRDCVAYGPGIIDLAHQPDEYVGIEDMVQASQVMGLALGQLLSATERDTV